jgi:threonine dehydrogenase-like Zn-dependent dehydrogenase
MSMHIRELWHIDQIRSEIREEDYTNIPPDSVLIKSIYSLVSNGTERIIAKGLVPESLKGIMRVPNMQGSFDFPLKYGYSLVGTVIQGPPGLTGKTVYLMHPHQDFVIAPQSSLLLIPEKIPVRRAVMYSNLETAVNVIWESSISPGDRILICGFGLIGALIAILARLMPAITVVVHEIDLKRKELARAMGFRIFNPDDFTPGFFDLAINSSASGEGLQLCIDATRPQSKIIEVSWYGSDSVNIRLGDSFHVGQKQIISSQVSTIPLSKQAHFDLHRRHEVVMDLLQNEDLDTIPFNVIDFDSLPLLFSQLRNKTYSQFATLVKY